MALIELSKVFLEYAPFEEEVAEEKPKKKREKESSGEKTQAVFEEFPDVKPEEKKAEERDNKQHIYAVSDVSLTISEGEYIALVGRNGSGKSTLAKLLNGLLLPSKGSVTVDGKSTAEKANLFEIRKKVGMVFQNPDNQMIASIVEDDIAFGPENIGIPPEEIRERVKWALSSVGMSEYAGATPFKLSGGQKQRIAIAGMLAIRPRVLVLDESTAMLDPKGRREVTEVVKKLNREEKMTIINITHYMDEVSDCDRVIVMDGGKTVMDAPPREVFSRKAELIGAGLALPNVMQIGEMLKERGVRLSGDAFTEKELVSKIWELWRKS